MSRALAAALVAATLVLAPPFDAGAEEAEAVENQSEHARFQIFLRYGTSWVGDPSFDLVSENDLRTRVELGFGYVPSWFDNRLRLELGYGSSGSEALLFDAADSSLSLYSILGSGSYALARHRLGRLFVGAGAELVFATLNVDDISEHKQTDTLLGLQGLLGYELNLFFDADSPEGGSGMNFSVEAGYEFFPFPARFDDLQRSGSTKTSPAPIRTRGIRVGELDPSGWMLRFGAAVRF